MTARYAALLRGINVGGARKVPMARLRALLEDLGFTGVATYLQSGNAVFTDPGAGTARDAADAGADGGTASGPAAEAALAARIEAGIEKEFGFRVDTLVRDHAYLRGLVDDCPFPAADLAGRQLHVVYLSQDVDAAALTAALPVDAHLPEEYRVGDRALYLYTPDGIGRSKLAAALSAPRPLKGMVATARNWNTVTKLVEMTRD
ncbi:DUF1697 domain-containing protein [Streptomyces sp. NPDC005805]|uniref:DUF1697 domain-containing protein n=1 Tax=Streptomyces sp. NPDC005805 TaxID=3157068 RepID=UPI0033D9A6BA